MFSTHVNISGYQIIEEIYNGSRTVVYRGYRESDSLPVAIKLLKNPYPSFNELVQFRNQYTIAKNLNSSLIVQTYSLEVYQNAYALVMEDFGGISLKDYFDHDQTRDIRFLQEFFQIAIALCNTLDILYSQRIIHKDIKPSNILINPDSKQVKLIDFSIASLLPRETQTLISPNVLEGTLAYISPEQTGRMNRGIDYRTDFYSLGVTFYELLTGELPFQSNDPMELVHSHIAKVASSIDVINLQIPPIISDIVSKLMAKNAEDRYQSVLGLKHDVEICFAQLKTTGKIESFPIAERDVCDRFIIPDKLYGREAEVETLLEAFENVSLSATEITLVAGFSGIGKTAVVNEVHKPIVRQHGYFIKGKFDQFNRNIPFSAFVQAFRNFMDQLLAESDVQIQKWQNQIIQALGEDGQVIIEVIPELEKIIGRQPPASELSGNAAQNRFNLLFQKFLQIFTTKEHPLVIFLDDLQWVDSASLKLIQLLMNEANQGYLLLIGAYRDNEVFPAHPLMVMLDEIRKTGVKVNSLTLKPLNQLQLNQLVADTLNCAENVALSLSQLIYRKAQGNPFFATQILKSLHQDQLIQFNFAEGCWQCDISQINQQTLADNVVDFMVFQLRRLPESTQQQLKLAACIGNQFDLKTLAIVSKQSEIETADCLWKALQEGLILPQSEVYKFFVGSENQAAIANELAAKFYLEWGKQKAAEGYLQQAYYHYAHWGAKAKTDDLEKRYPKLLKPILQQQEFNFNPLETIASIARTSTYTTSNTNISDTLDLTCILKAAQTISSCIELDALISSLTRIILENSGAKTSVLILPQEDTWQVRAITFIDQQSNSRTDIKTILDSQLLDACQDIPRKLINYVKNTQETVIIDNCKTNIPGVIGEYMLLHQPQSVLCTPIINQGHLVGIIYLENQLNQGVFTSNRLQVINLLSSQAAIALENARLYQQAGQALQDLQQAQLQIVQSEKMSALGNLVAGIAHEMNNPLGFIAASLIQAKPTFTDVIEHLKLYEQRFPTPGDEILTHAEEIDLEYSLEDFPKMIDSMTMACDRLKNISTSLRTFSRADRDYKVPFDIHEGIDSTILILKHRLKANDTRPTIEIVADYGNLPQIKCFPGQLNQVFMNIIANAIDALDESNTGRSFHEIKANPNLITITTSLKEKQVEVKIADNGQGMSESVKQKVFDHLFTTKGVGKGTGLGLAIAQSIVVEKHGGTLDVNSTPGVVTEFVITLPILV